MDAVVVDEEKTAIDCIEYMRNHRAGHATFIPLDSIQVKPINDKYRSFAKGARLAVDVIQYEPAVERAIQHACGNALVCDTMDVARYVVFDKGQEVKAVTLDGTVIHKSGLITGGRSTRDSTKKWDETDVKGLSRVKDNLHAQLTDLQSKKPRGKADEALLLEVERLESSLVVARDDLNAAQLRRTGILQQSTHVRDQLDTLAPQVNAATVNHDQLREQVETLQAVISEADDSVFGDFCRRIGAGSIRDYEERQLKVAQVVSEARHRFDTQIARLTTQVKFEEEQLRTTQARLGDLDNIIRTEDKALVLHEQTKQQIEEEIRDAEASIEELKEDLAKANEDLENRTTQVEQAKRAFNKATKAVDQVLKDIATKNGEIEKSGLERSSIYRRCRVDEIKIPLLKGNLKNVPMEENLRDEVAMQMEGDEDESERPRQVQDYGIEVDYSELEDEEMEDSSPEAAARFDEEIAKVTAEIERMAPNLKAVERLDDVEAKLVETEKEAEKARKDSKNARDQFNDVKQRRYELFMKAYNHVSERIDAVYKDLTRGKAAPMGGVAYLSLEDSEEPYVAGIKYHAMPPMKRFRDMEQLSGGEKTIAALALLFAIHSFQPSPFFVLDEVDAALDNTNVAKIANYIRSHASDTFQFIVISLKGSLYERSNSLVGIYRDQDVNSSQTLTLDLTQYDE
ncbi:hypothetical protein BDM02DRAFT_2623366 [Thelephora ganbajun]|uniref:Uncharacterized protein n=1 Tax=Thelephora ganbajun TaxID=370292 RepID=A0ACB6ZTL1_THEGA|nr:hypothetical protein BDM02DRAFT_2623366 [Thelephora ganbajun]